MKFTILLFLILLISCDEINLDMNDRQLVFEDKFNSLDNFNVKNGEFYNDNDVWFNKEMVLLTDSGLVIKCVKDTSEHETWQGRRITNWTSGMIDTYNKVEFSGGLWIINAKLNSLWPAIWLLKVGYIPDGFTRGTIIPEVDIVETIHNKFRHTVHWGYSNDPSIYRLYETGENVKIWDDKFHNFAVDILSNGYDFYIDGIMTASFRSDNPQFVSDQKSYLIINNAATSEDYTEEDIVIKSIKFYR